MAYFHGPLKSKGGKKRRIMRVVCGETIDEILNVARRWPEATTINLPRREKNAWKSGRIPQLHVDADRLDILQELNSAEVSQEHIDLMTMLLREDFFKTRCEKYMTGEVEKYFELEVRGKLIQLLRRGKWIDDPENLGLKKWNNWIENWDLGRRSDLNFSSNPISIDRVQKYDQDFKVSRDGSVQERHKEPSKEPNLDFSTLYREGTKVVRHEILSQRPWMRTMLVEQFGEPDATDL